MNESNEFEGTAKLHTENEEEIHGVPDAWNRFNIRDFHYFRDIVGVNIKIPYEKDADYLVFSNDMFNLTRKLNSDSQDIAGSSTEEPRSILGVWTGIIPSPTNSDDWIGFKINFKSIDGDVVRGNFINVDNESSTPSYFKGIAEAFTAKYNEDIGTFLLDINGENMTYKFGLDGVFEYKYGRVILNREEKDDVGSSFVDESEQFWDNVVNSMR